MKKLSVFLILKIAFFFLVLNSLYCFAGERATREECIEKCNRALKMIEKDGLESVIPIINDKKSPFVWKDSYVCLMNNNAVFLAHAYLPKSYFGLSLINLKDSNGKEYLKESLNVANTKGKGWVSYLYPNSNGVEREKITYVLKSKKADVVILAGIFSDKKIEGPKVDIPDFNLPDIRGKKVAFIIGNNGHEDSEFSIPKEMIEKAGGKTEAFAQSKGIAYGMYGHQTKIKYVIGDLKVSDFDAVIFVGGNGTRAYLENPTAHKIARDIVKEGKVLGAICWAPVILANAKVIDGKKATVHPNQRETIKKYKCIYTGDKVTVDGKIITADSPESSPLFAKAIIESLNLL